MATDRQERRFGCAVACSCGRPVFFLVASFVFRFFFPVVDGGGLPQESNRIVGGEEASVGEYPYLVGLATDLHQPPRCGGSIIDSEYVLTAAHCFPTFPAGDYILEQVNYTQYVVYGSARAEVAWRVPVVRLWIHEGFELDTLWNDVALLKLGSPIPFSFAAASIRLSSSSGAVLPPGADLMIGGWGRVREQGNVSALLRAATIDHIPGLCESQYKQLDYSSAEFVCAGCVSAGTDACKGDSGGPLSSLSASGGCPVQIGIVSYGRGCGRELTPTAYTKVSLYLDWLEGIVRKPLRSTVDVSPTLHCDTCNQIAGLPPPSADCLSTVRFDPLRCQIEAHLAASFQLAVLPNCIGGSTYLSASFGGEIAGIRLDAGKVYMLQSSGGSGSSSLQIDGVAINTPLQAPVFVTPASAPYDPVAASWHFSINGCTADPPPPSSSSLAGGEGVAFAASAIAKAGTSSSAIVRAAATTAFASSADVGTSSSSSSNSKSHTFAALFQGDAVFGGRYYQISLPVTLIFR